MRFVIYRSNLTGPDLSPHFRLLSPPKQIAGHDAPSDPDFGPECTWWTHDEAAILYSVAKSVPAGTWVDIGARLGWTAAHLTCAHHEVRLVDPSLRFAGFSERMERNLLQARQWDGIEMIYAVPWAKAPITSHILFDGFVIDGCHDSPEPLNDATRAATYAKPDCIIMLHDFMGEPVRDAVRWLMDNGWRCRIYWTPNGVACCWREACQHTAVEIRTTCGTGPSDGPFGSNIKNTGVCMECKTTVSRHGSPWTASTAWSKFEPPDHVSDPAIDFRPHKAGMVDFERYWERCE